MSGRRGTTRLGDIEVEYCKECGVVVVDGELHDEYHNRRTGPPEPQGQPSPEFLQAHQEVRRWIAEGDTHG